MQINGEPDAIGPCVRGEFQPMLLALLSDLQGLCDSSGEGCIGLECVVALSLDHHVQLREPLRVKLATRDV